MASFEERVKAAHEAYADCDPDYAHETAMKIALRAADSTEPEIGAMRRWLAGETVDVEALPERLREVLSERDECSPRIASLLATDEPVTADPTAPRFSAEVGSRAVPEALTREAREGAVAAVIHRSRGVQTAEQTAREVVRALDEADTRVDATRIDAVARVLHDAQPTIKDFPFWRRVAVEALRAADAYKKAKAENDERFMRERDEARSEVARLTQERDEARAEVARLSAERDENVELMDALGQVANLFGYEDVEDAGTLNDLVEEVRASLNERDALAAKVREQAAALTRARAALDEAFPIVHEEDTELGDEMEFASNEITAVLDDAAAKTTMEADEGIDAAPPERVPTAEEAVVLRRFVTGKLEVPRAHVGTAPDDCELAGWTEGRPPDEDAYTITPAGRAALARFEAQEAERNPTPGDGGGVIDWRARALAAEAEVAEMRDEINVLREKAQRLSAIDAHVGAPLTWKTLKARDAGDAAMHRLRERLEAEVARLRAALERATAPLTVDEMSDIRFALACRGVCVGDTLRFIEDMNEFLAARRAEAMGGSDADA